ncbi:MAG: hypothetical protein HC844_17390 [Tabrizicola sp.]|nr:hypothetical protein [Tabrizicola sp.]
MAYDPGKALLAGVAALALLPAAAVADEMMTAAEFETFTAGRTLTFAVEGVVYGTEDYLADRQVIWAYVGGPCQSGIWYPKGKEICFTYIGDPGPHCRLFWRQGDGLRATATTDGPDAPVREIANSPHRLSCDWPEPGV